MKKLSVGKVVDGCSRENETESIECRKCTRSTWEGWLRYIHDCDDESTRDDIRTRNNI